MSQPPIMGLLQQAVQLQQLLEARKLQEVASVFTVDYYIGGFIKISTNSAAGTQVANPKSREIEN